MLSVISSLLFKNISQMKNKVFLVFGLKKTDFGQIWLVDFTLGGQEASLGRKVRSGLLP